MQENAIMFPKATPRFDATLALDAPVKKVRAVTETRAKVLEKLSIYSIRDLLLHLPTHYLDYTDLSSIAAARIGEETTIVGSVGRIKVKQTRRFPVTEVYLLDNTGVLKVTFFRAPWVSRQVSEGDVLAVSGKVKFSYGYKEMASPFWEKVADHGARESSGVEAQSYARIVPVHALTQGISAAWMRRLEINALEKVHGLLDFLPSHLLTKYGFMGLSGALSAVHFPHSLPEAEAARRRLAFDELICLQLALRARAALFGEPTEGYSHTIEGQHIKALRKALPFKLTEEQDKAVQEILADMARVRPMNRLLLGDVGTGKTIVATFACVAAADSESQAAVMVPTSVLASQYASKVGELLDAVGVSWALLTGSTPQAERANIEKSIASGEISVVFGTQALLSKNVTFKKLSLVVVDEQHRFGVEQRASIAEKGKLADILTMTATPIPRTLALSLYGDVEVSRIKNRPIAGAGSKTVVLTPENLDIAYGAIEQELQAGHQAYVVCARIEEEEDKKEQSDTTQQGRERKLLSAEQVYKHYSSQTFKNWRVGLLTGALKPQEKDDVMAQFRDHKLDILVSTTVIEVGVDVPNATALLVLDADRFGLATLHQLRGRVGRGSVSGKVFLSSPYSKKSASRQRLEALEKSNDGFELAELDLKLRHEGDIVGFKQSGETTLSVADLVKDIDLVEAAYREVSEMLQNDETLRNPTYVPLVYEVLSRYKHIRSQGGRS